MNNHKTSKTLQPKLKSKLYKNNLYKLATKALKDAQQYGDPTDERQYRTCMKALRDAAIELVERPDENIRMNALLRCLRNMPMGALIIEPFHRYLLQFVKASYFCTYNFKESAKNLLLVNEMLFAVDELELYKVKRKSGDVAEALGEGINLAIMALRSILESEQDAAYISTNIERAITHIQQAHNVLVTPDEN